MKTSAQLRKEHAEVEHIAECKESIRMVLMSLPPTERLDVAFDSISDLLTDDQCESLGNRFCSWPQMKLRAHMQQEK